MGLTKANLIHRMLCVEKIKLLPEGTVCWDIQKRGNYIIDFNCTYHFLKLLVTIKRVS